MYVHSLSTSLTLFKYLIYYTGKQYTSPGATKYYSPYFAMCQSSGYGKSRLIHEVIERGEEWRESGRRVEGERKESGRRAEGEWKESGRRAEGERKESGRRVEGERMESGGAGE
jgi:hypothetical protein